MKSIRNFLENLKELISEATQNRSEYENMKLIPILVRNNERRLPNPNGRH